MARQRPRTETTWPRQARSRSPDATGDWILVNVNGDAFNQDDEAFSVTLTSAVGGTIEKANGPR